MQSVDLAPVDGDSELNNDNDVVVESKTLPQLSNDGVMAESGVVSDNDNDNDWDVVRKSGDETVSFQVEEDEGLGMEEGEEDMEVNFVETSGTVVSEQSKHSDDLGSEEGNQGSWGKARFHSSAQH